ncbi:MAG: hypothetical protein OQK35_03405 [Alphaproteobacteria bacterium]|nr:hypothetical protein [Rhodospirillales bacterium]MCW9045359.1 hypothetical protein [Alphaproteobacteria bacterium]
MSEELKTIEETCGGFFGLWMLDLSRSTFEQNEPPQSATHRLELYEGHVVFYMNWIDAEGQDFEVKFAGIPDGQIREFPGGELADAMSVTAPSELELNTSAFLKGNELMTATRLLVENGSEMLLTQTVHLPDGVTLQNKSLYVKEI